MKLNVKIAHSLLKAIKEIDLIDEPLAADILFGFIKDTPYIQVYSSDYSIGYKCDSIELIKKAVNEAWDYKINGIFLINFVSEDFVLKEFNELLYRVKISKDSNEYNLIINEVNSFFNRLNVENYLIFYKIYNLKCSILLNLKDIKIFSPEDSYLIDKLSEYKIEISNKLLVDSSSDKNNYCIAEISVKAIEVKKANEIAFLKIKEFLNIFSLIAGSENIYIEGEPTHVFKKSFAISVDKKRFHGMSEILVSKKQEKPIDLEQFKESKLFTWYISILQKEHLSPLEDKILNSLNWLGEANKEIDIYHKILKMIISLECLLLEKERGGKLFLIEERASLILDNTYEKRIKNRNLIREAYQIRNNIVHGGKKSFIKRNLLNHLSYVILSLNLKIIRTENFKKFDDITKYVESLKYRQ